MITIFRIARCIEYFTALLTQWNQEFLFIVVTKMARSATGFHSDAKERLSSPITAIRRDTLIIKEIYKKAKY